MGRAADSILQASERSGGQRGPEWEARLIYGPREQPALRFELLRAGDPGRQGCTLAPASPRN